MKPTRWLVLVYCAAALLLLPLGRAISAGSPIDDAFDHFWSTTSPEEAAQRIPEILKTGVTFEDALSRLKTGRTYHAEKGGVVTLHNQTADSVTHYFSVDVPEGYDPAKTWQLRFQLHGGVSGRSSSQPRGSGAIGPLAGPAEQFYVLPYAWDDAPWWSEDQVLNFDAMLDQLKRTYNINENRVVLSGVSDGGTGTYYMAMRNTTPFASFLPLNGFLLVLASGGIDDGRMFPNNLVDKPMFVVNGGKDPLYPTEIVDPFVKHLTKGGVDLTYHPQPDAGHNTAWWPNLKDAFEAFVANHPRQPHPEHLTWETNNLTRNRAHWLLIDQLGSTANDAKSLTDLNRMADPVTGDPTLMDIFLRKKPSGRVDLVRSGNTVQATTRGVTSFTLLLSPDAFDFSKPIRVDVNGHKAFEAKMQASVETLLKWAARDNDRTMLYGAELQIQAAP